MSLIFDKNEIEKYVACIDRFNAADNWSKIDKSCMICAKHTHNPVCQTPHGLVCTDCAASVYDQFTSRQEIGLWHYSRFYHALSQEGILQLRLTVLNRYPESVQIVMTQSGADIDMLHRLLIKNLDYRTHHPLASAVRQQALRACVQVGQPLLPFLLEHRNNPGAWEFYFNIILCVGMIAPDSKVALEFFEEAGRHPVSEIREKVISILSRQKSPLAKKIYRQLVKGINSNQPPQSSPASVRTASQKQPRLALPSHAVSVEKTKMVIPNSLSDLETAISDCYSAETLKIIFSRYLEPLFQDIDFETGKSFGVNKLKKRQLIWALAQVFSQPDQFEKLLASLPDGVIQVLNRVTWEKGDVLAHFFGEFLDPPIIRVTQERMYGKMIAIQSISPEYVIIPFKNEYSGYQYPYSQNRIYSFFLPELIRKNLKQFLSPPRGYYLTPLEGIDKTDFVHEDTDAIVSQIHLLYTYITQGNIQFQKNGRKLLKTSAKDMILFCHIQEFYPDQTAETAYLKTGMIVDFLRNQFIKENPDPLKFLQQIFQIFFSDSFSTDDYRLFRLLFHLKGLASIDTSYFADRMLKYEKIARASLYGLLRELSPGMWYDIAGLITYCRYRDIELDIVDYSLASSYLSADIKVKDSSRYYSSVKTEISRSKYPEAILKPFLKGFMFLMAAFGVVDIAYNHPQNTEIQKKDLNYLSVFDGLQYIRLTRLGAYLLGLSDDYAITIQKENARIELDEKRLLIHLDGPDRIKEMILRQFAEKISENSFKVTFDSFLKDCKTQDNIEDKILLFRRHVFKTPPVIWENFLDDVLVKVEPLIPKPDMYVFQLKEQAELIALMAQDEVLQKHIMKAEDYHVLIPARHLNTVKKRLEKFGFFIQQLR